MILPLTEPKIVGVGEGLLEIGIGGDGEVVLPLLATVGAGGDVPNILVAASLNGVRSSLISAVGADTAGAILTTFWNERGVDTSGVAVSKSEPTGTYINTTTATGHSFDYYRSGSAASSYQFELDVEASLVGASALVISGISIAAMPEKSLAWVDQAAACGVPVAVVLNHRASFHAPLATMSKFLDFAHWILGSIEDVEAMQLCGDNASSEQFGSMIRDSYPRAVEVVMTDGANGATALFGSETVKARAQRIEVVDAAGAGDAFAGAYLAHRLLARPVQESLVAAVSYASQTTLVRGCAVSYPKVVVSR